MRFRTKEEAEEELRRVELRLSESVNNLKYETDVICELEEKVLQLEKAGVEECEDLRTRLKQELSVTTRLERLLRSCQGENAALAADVKKLTSDLCQAEQRADLADTMAMGLRDRLSFIRSSARLAYELERNSTHSKGVRFLAKLILDILEQ